ncbi:MAG: hypothetical protein K6F99_08950 [Lachnospiraceae bacterium]|nr:hypothetical protein [Lachnospiraceae bacterium]
MQTKYAIALFIPVLLLLLCSGGCGKKSGFEQELSEARAAIENNDVGLHVRNSKDIALFFSDGDELTVKNEILRILDNGKWEGSDEGAVDHSYVVSFGQKSAEGKELKAVFNIADDQIWLGDHHTNVGDILPEVLKKPLYEGLLSADDVEIDANTFFERQDQKTVTFISEKRTYESLISCDVRCSYYPFAEEEGLKEGHEGWQYSVDKNIVDYGEYYLQTLYDLFFGKDRLYETQGWITGGSDYDLRLIFHFAYGDFEIKLMDGGLVNTYYVDYEPSSVFDASLILTGEEFAKKYYSYYELPEIVWKTAGGETGNADFSSWGKINKLSPDYNDYNAPSANTERTFEKLVSADVRFNWDSPYPDERGVGYSKGRRYTATKDTPDALKSLYDLVFTDKKYTLSDQKPDHKYHTVYILFHFENEDYPIYLSHVARVGDNVFQVDPVPDCGYIPYGTYSQHNDIPYQVPELILRIME